MIPTEKVKITRGVKKGWTGTVKRAAENIPGFYWIRLEKSGVVELFNGTQLKPAARVERETVMLRLINLGRKKVNKTILLSSRGEINKELSKHINSTVIDLHQVGNTDKFKVTIGAGLTAGHIEVFNLAA